MRETCTPGPRIDFGPCSAGLRSTRTFCRCGRRIGADHAIHVRRYRSHRHFDRDRADVESREHVVAERIDRVVRVFGRASAPAACAASSACRTSRRGRCRTTRRAVRRTPCRRCQRVNALRGERLVVRHRQRTDVGGHGEHRLRAQIHARVTAHLRHRIALAQDAVPSDPATVERGDRRQRDVRQRQRQTCQGIRELGLEADFVASGRPSPSAFGVDVDPVEDVVAEVEVVRPARSAPAPESMFRMKTTLPGFVQLLNM